MGDSFGVCDSLIGEVEDLTIVNDSVFIGAGWGYEGSKILFFINDV